MKTYRDVYPQGTSEEVRSRNHVGEVFLNSAKCNLCGDVLVSNHRHDFKGCSCGNLHVDGGSQYCKRNYREVGSYTELSEMYK